MYQPEHALLIAVGLALLLPEPGRWNPFTLARSAARVFARDLPHSGRWAVPAGWLLLAMVAALAALTAWLLTQAVPTGLSLVAPNASPIVALALAAIALRFTFRLPPIWAWRERIQRRGAWPCAPTSSPDGAAVVPNGLAAACAMEFAAPVLLVAFLGLYAVVVYRAALEVAAALSESTATERLGAAAAWVAYIPAAPAERWVTLLSARAGGVRLAPGQSPTPTSAAEPANPRAFAVAVAATIALALLVTIW